MVYSPTTWVNGDLITAALFNNTETQYAQYLATYGPFKFTTGTSTDTQIWSAAATTYNQLISNALYQNFKSAARVGGAGNAEVTINIPTNIQPSKLSFYISGRTCAAGNVCQIWLSRIYIVGGALSFDLSAGAPSYTFNSTAVVTYSTMTLNVYPGERILIINYGNAANNACFWDLKLYGASTTPGTGVVNAT